MENDDMGDAAAVIDRESVRQWLTGKIAEYRKLDAATIESDVPLANYGLDSVIAVTLTVDVEERYDLVLEPDTFWEYSTIDLLADLIATQLSGAADLSGSS
jgi:acyl carrier protein